MKATHTHTYTLNVYTATFQSSAFELFFVKKQSWQMPNRSEVYGIPTGYYKSIGMKNECESHFRVLWEVSIQKRFMKVKSLSGLEIEHLWFG